MKSLPFFASLRGKILLYCVLPTIAIFCVLIVIEDAKMFETVLAENEVSLQILAEQVAADIERGNTRAVLTAEVMAKAQSKGLFGKRVESSEFVKEILVSYPEFTAAYIVYEPNADGRDAEAIAPGASTAMAQTHDASGRFAPYWFRNRSDNTKVELEPSVDMETSLYYKGCKELFREKGKATAMVTEPYVYEGKMIVEQTFPIVLDGQFQGVAGVDRALDDIDRFLESIKERESVDLFLISRESKFVAVTSDQATTDEKNRLNAKSVSETPYRELFGDQNLGGDAKHLKLAADPIDREPYFFAAASIPSGDWFVVIRKPKDDITGPIWAKIYFLLGIATVCVIIVVLLSIMTVSSIAKRLNLAVGVATRLSSGDLRSDDSLHIDNPDQPLSHARSQDEVGLLVKALSTMRRNLRNLFVDVKDAGDSVSAASERVSSQSQEIVLKMSDMNELSVSTSGDAQAAFSNANNVAASTQQMSATSSTVAASANVISHSLDGIAAAVEQSSSNMRTVASSSDEMASSVNSIASAIEEISTSLLDVSKNTVTAAGIAQNASATAQKTQESVDHLGESASEIGKIVDIISAIASQSNLLALNASIEAASAGEAGKGFAVVANEVKELAKRTAIATEEIRSQVDHIQSRTATSVGDIRGILSIVDEINSITGTIAASVEEQSAACNAISADVAKTANEVRSVTENVNEAALGVNEVSENVQNAVGEVGAITANIKELALGATDVAKNASESCRSVENISLKLGSITETAKGVITQTDKGQEAAQALMLVSKKLNENLSTFRLGDDVESN